MKTIHTRDFNNQGNKISCTVDVKDGKDVITSEVIEFRTKEEMNGRLKNILNVANVVSEVFPTLSDGEWTAPTVKEAVVAEPTAAEIVAQVAARKEIDLYDAVAKAKLNKEAAEMALTDTNVAAKLEAIRGTNDVTKDSLSKGEVI